ncbi:BA75_04609T0 [Komagataella pastoris]|uniref:tRNA(Ile)-lysidine synthetase n=1 Tax=Komagataella pastoris TaxID=4922 RepID=A0A1B2JIW7_PICPA|nr:BA75_04609T0 [Komagataella pastoris]
MNRKIFDAFSDNIVRIFPHGIPRRVGISLSGGVDSMALTSLLSRYRDEYNVGVELVALTVNHEYRKGSRQEAEEVGKLLAPLRVQHKIIDLKWNLDSVELHQLGNFERLARTKRYQHIQRYCYDHDIQHLFLGHQLEDQVETFLLRLKQNSTIFGMRCMKDITSYPSLPLYPSSVKPPIKIVRPMLNIRKQDIYSYCKELEVPWFEDHTNTDSSLTFRNLMRSVYQEGNLSIPETLTQQHILQVISEIESFQQSIYSSLEELRHELNRLGQIWYDPATFRLNLLLSGQILKRYHPLVINRFFYEECYKISPLKSYHYKFTNLDVESAWVKSKSTRSIYSILKRVVFSKGHPEKFSLLKLNWEISSYKELGSDCVNVSISPAKYHANQPLPMIELSLDHNNEWSEWVFFDNRCWIRIKATDEFPIFGHASIKIVPYVPKLHSTAYNMFMESQPGNCLPNKILTNIPVLLLDDLSVTGKILGLPSLGMIDTNWKNRIQVEFIPKNEFDQISSRKSISSN